MSTRDSGPGDPGHEPTGRPKVEDPARQLATDLAEFLTAIPLLRPVHPAKANERRLWRACELCIYLGYRVDPCPDPRTLSEPAIADWAKRGLAPGEGLGDPADLDPYQPYWVYQGERPIGTIAFRVQDSGWGGPNLWMASLFLFPEARREGWGTLVVALVEAVAHRLGMTAIRLESDWLWQGALRFYLRQGFWVAHWKRGLSLVRYRQDPAYRVRSTRDRMTFELRGEWPGPLGAQPDGDPQPLLAARRQGDTLIWEEPAAAVADPNALAALADLTRASPSATFALWLAVAGWPLVRGPEAWERRHHWSDTGMPEGLGYKIGIFEAYARHLGLRVDTPRIPGLSYPEWDELR